MRHFIRFLIFLTGLAAISSSAQAYVELNVFYTGESLNSGTASSENRTFLEGSVGFAVDKDSRFLVGWYYGSFSSSNSGSTSTTYTSSQMGPRFIFAFNRSKTWTIGAAYNLVTTGNFDNGSGALKWSGTAYKLDTGYNFDLTDSLFLGLRLNYNAANYTSQLSGATNYSTNSNSSSYIYPSLYMIYLF